MGDSKQIPGVIQYFAFPVPEGDQGSKYIRKKSQKRIFYRFNRIYKFSSDEEVINMANDTPYGLASYFYSRDIGRVWRVAEALEYGMVGVNTGLTTKAEIPFGGIKESGLGREGGKYGLEDYLEIKYISMAGI